MRKKVIVRIKGGLGNQLFCYTAARRLALVNDAELVIDDVTGFVRDRQYRREYLLDRFSITTRKATSVERMEPFERYRRALSKFINRRRMFFNRTYIEQEGMDFDSRLLELKVRGTVYLDGYWQSEGYFKDVETIIRLELRIKPPNDVANGEMTERISDCVAVAVHVRFFDATDSPSISNVPSDYYAKAVARMETLVPYAQYFVFSDELDAARALIPLGDTRITRVSHNPGEANAYADLWLMTHCHHFIIANSTFSWWGAWLSNYRDKIVIAPGIKLKGIGAWGFEGLIPEGWLTI